MAHPNKPYEDRWHQSQVRECVDLWELTEEESNKLMKFKEKVADVDHWLNDPFELVRFLRSPLCQGNVKTMAHLFRNCVHYRREHAVDTILQDYSPPLLYNYYPLAVMEGCDNVGDFVIVGRAGAADCLGLARRFGKEEGIQTFLFNYELLTRGPWIQDRKQQRLKRALVVYDLKGLSLRHCHPSLVSTTQELGHMEKILYPNWGKKLLLVNCPPIFSFAWTIFKPVIPAYARKKIEFATEATTEEVVSKYMDVSILPKEVLPGKGMGRAARGFEPIWEGGILPPPSDDDWKRRDPISYVTSEENPVKVSSRLLFRGSFDDDASIGLPSAIFVE